MLTLLLSAQAQARHARSGAPREHHAGRPPTPRFHRSTKGKSASRPHARHLSASLLRLRLLLRGGQNSPSARRTAGKATSRGLGRVWLWHGTLLGVRSHLHTSGAAFPFVVERLSNTPCCEQAMGATGRSSLCLTRGARPRAPLQPSLPPAGASFSAPSTYAPGLASKGGKLHLLSLFSGPYAKSEWPLAEAARSRLGA